MAIFQIPVAGTCERQGELGNGMTASSGVLMSRWQPGMKGWETSKKYKTEDGEGMHIYVGLVSTLNLVPL